MAYDQNTRTLIATFKDYSTARQAAQELENEGFSSDQVQIDSNQKTAGAGSSSSYETTTTHTEEESHTGIAGWWNSLFGDSTEHDDEDRVGYEGALKGGSTILRATVETSDVDSVADILNRYGATDVDRPSSSTTKTPLMATNTSGASKMGTTSSDAPIQVVEEELQVGKRAIQRGGVRVYSHLVSKAVEEKVNLREEHVNVERRQVNREISPDDVSALRDQTIEMTEMAEEAVVAKRARVTEEILIGKEATERTETVRDNVRHTEVEIEQIGQEPQYAGSIGSSKTTKATGMSPNAPTPGVQSSGAGTAGAGTLAGTATAGLTSQDYTPDYRKNFEQSYGADSDFESIRPAYEYGYTNASNAQYRGKSWDQVESNLRSDYEKNNPGSTWEKTKGAVRYGWDKVTGKA